MTAEQRQLVWSILFLVVAICGIVWLLTGGTGCASWQTKATKTVLGIEAGGKAALAFIDARCPVKQLEAECTKTDDKECKPLRKCLTAYKVLDSLTAAILATKLAIQYGHEPTSKAALSALLRLLPTAQRMVETWK